LTRAPKFCATVSPSRADASKVLIITLPFLIFPRWQRQLNGYQPLLAVPILDKKAG
jgi:hypothetical protein